MSGRSSCYAAYEDLVIEKTRSVSRRPRYARLRFPSSIAYRWEANRWDEVRNADGVTGYVGERVAPELHRLADLG